MMSIEQAKMINKQKEAYNSWLNQNNNCTQSPNLNKVTNELTIDVISI